MRVLKAPDQGSPGSVSGEGDFPGLQMAIFSWCLHVMERERKLSRTFSYKSINPIGSELYLYDLFSFNYFHKGPISKYSHIEV